MSAIVIVGEAYGREEEAAREPFVGASGRLLKSLLRQVGISLNRCYLTNVFNLRPQSNDVKAFCGPKAEGIPGLPALVPGKYVRAEFKPELDRLFIEIENEEPNLVLALGATAAWALLETKGIKAIRGAPTWSQRANVKVLAAYHPAAVLRQWNLRPILMADLFKAQEEMEFPELIRPSREIWIEPSYSDLWRFYNYYMAAATHIATDIETKQGTVTCIGFAPSEKHALVVPFFDAAKRNYWDSAAAERAAWEFVRFVLSQNKSFIFQNGLYDMHYLWRTLGLVVPGAAEDTMLLHHALQPEMEKSLGFLGTIYTSESSWKVMRDKGTLKRED